MDTQLQNEMGRQYDSNVSPQSAEKMGGQNQRLFPWQPACCSHYLGNSAATTSVEELHSQLQQQAREIERMERMFSSPPQPTPNAQYTVHVPARMEL